MELLFKVSEEMQPVWVERFTDAIKKNQEELDKQLPSFVALERDYQEWKAKIDKLKLLIHNDKKDLETFVQASRLKEPKAKIRAVREFKKFEIGTGKEQWKPSPVIKWEEIVPPILIELCRFIRYDEMYKELIRRKLIADSPISKRKFTVACCSKANSWTNHTGPMGDKFIGLKTWMNGEGPLPEFLNDFRHAD